MWYKLSRKKYDTAIVAIWFDKKDIDQLGIEHNINKNDVTEDDEFHITLMYLGEIKTLEQNKYRIEKTLRELAKGHKPFDATVAGVAKFFTEKEKVPYVFTINAQELEPLRNDIRDSLEKVGIKEPEDSLPFIPHMTFGYTSPESDLNSLEVSKNTLKVKGIHLSWGGDLKFFKFD